MFLDYIIFIFKFCFCKSQNFVSICESESNKSIHWFIYQANYFFLFFLIFSLMSVYLSLYLSIYVPARPLITESSRLSKYPTGYFFFLKVYLSINIYPSICLSIKLSIYPHTSKTANQRILKAVRISNWFLLLHFLPNSLADHVLQLVPVISLYKHLFDYLIKGNFREGGDIGLKIILEPKGLYPYYIIRWLKKFACVV